MFVLPTCRPKGRRYILAKQMREAPGRGAQLKLRSCENINSLSPGRQGAKKTKRELLNFFAALRLCEISFSFASFASQPLTQGEVAFYDALEVDDSAVKVLGEGAGDDTLRTILTH